MKLLKRLWNWFTGKKGKEDVEKLVDLLHKEALSEKPVLKAPPPPPVIKKGTLEDIRDYCEEVRKTLRIYKQTCDKIGTFLWTYKKIVDALYVEVGNLKSKIVTYLEAEKRK